MIDFIEINGRKIGEGHPPYIIAEACINHQGKIGLAKQMVYVAHAMGCDAIKFQMHVLDDEMLRQAPQSDNFEKPLFDTLESTNLSMAEHRQLIDLCASLGIQYLCTPFSMASTDLVEELDVPAFKVGSGELTNLPLQKHIASKGRPMIVSTGMCTDDEVKETVDTLKKLDVPFALTHCVSAYPTPYDKVNLDNIPRYNKLYDVPVGLSDHTINVYTSVGAVALGACIIEKHFTLDRNLPGPDHQSSLEPYELGELVKGCRAVFEARGDKREIFPEEEEIVAWARESVVAITDIAADTIIGADQVSVKRPSPGPGAIAAKHLDEIIGKTAKTNISIDQQLLWEQVR
jgi:sialic acid synthase SpsE